MKTLILVLILVFFSIAFSADLKPEKESRLKAELQALINQQLKRKDANIINTSIWVDIPSKHFSFRGAGGLSDGQQEKMGAFHRYRIASESKVFTAVLILQLVEEGKIVLDRPLADYLDSTKINLDHLHQMGKISSGRMITIRQLLNHSSGLADYVFDNPTFIAHVRSNPTVQWTPSLILESYFSSGLNLQPFFAPGTGFHYSDTNFVLLAMVVERLYQRPLAEVLRKKIFGPLKMKNTYLEWYEKAITNRPLSHSFSGPIDNFNVNTSFDWGGGGIISTSDDLNKFLRGLFQSKLFKKSETLKTMTDWQNNSSPTRKYYAFGISHLSVGRFDLIGHTGIYGSSMVIDPKYDVSILFTLNQAEKPNEFELLKKIAQVLDRSMK